MRISSSRNITTEGSSATAQQQLERMSAQEEEDVPLVVVRSARELWWEDVANQPPLFCSYIARNKGSASSSIWFQGVRPPHPSTPTISIAVLVPVVVAVVVVVGVIVGAVAVAVAVGAAEVTVTVAGEEWW